MSQLKSQEIKSPKTSFNLHELIQKRWSPRSFSDKEITEEQLFEFFEAARWAASSSNRQPWQYYYATKGTSKFTDIADCLNDGNKIWAKDAQVLIISTCQTIIEDKDKVNQHAMHDTGMANSQLVLQAMTHDIYSHMMAGFKADEVNKLLNLSESEKPVCVIALGYLGDPNNLPEFLKERELTARSRKPLEGIIQKL